MTRKRRPKTTTGVSARTGATAVACPSRHVTTTRNPSFICRSCHRRYKTADCRLHELPASAGHQGGAASPQALAARPGLAYQDFSLEVDA